MKHYFLFLKIGFIDLGGLFILVPLWNNNFHICSLVTKYIRCPVTFSAICKCNLNENESICLDINSALNTGCIFISVSLLTQLMTRLWPHQFAQIFHEKYWSLLRLKYNHLSPEVSNFLFKNIIKLGTFQCKLAKRILNPQNQRQNWLLW